jgi:predicted dehydrogenase
MQKTKAKLFKHYQEMYQMKGLDAVIIATPIHWHALQFIDACKQKLPVFLEKPVFYDIREGQMMVKAAQEAANITKVNFIRLQSNAYKEAKAYIDSGKAGKIYQVEANLHFPAGGNLVEKPVPATLDYELWCGPAPVTPYLCPPDSEKINWRAIDAYCHGHLYDWGIHHINTLRHVMNLDIPNSIMAMGGNTRYKATTPDYLSVQFDFNGLPVTWNHRIWGSAQFNDETTDGMFFYGEKETVFLRDWGWSVVPTDTKLEKRTVGKLSFEWQDLGNFVDAQMQEFANAIKTMKREAVLSPIEDAFKTTVAVNLADIAYKAKSSIEFDAANMRIKNSEQANHLLKREYRKPYQHPYV